MGEWVLGPPMGRNSPWAPWVATGSCRLPPLSGTVQSHGVGGVQTQGTGSCPSQAVIFMRGQPLGYP